MVRPSRRSARCYRARPPGTVSVPRWRFSSRDDAARDIKERRSPVRRLTVHPAAGQPLIRTASFNSSTRTPLHSRPKIGYPIGSRMVRYISLHSDLPMRFRKNFCATGNTTGRSGSMFIRSHGLQTLNLSITSASPVKLSNGWTLAMAAAF